MHETDRHLQQEVRVPMLSQDTMKWKSLTIWSSTNLPFSNHSTTIILKNDSGGTAKIKAFSKPVKRVADLKFFMFRLAVGRKTKNYSGMLMPSCLHFTYNNLIINTMIIVKNHMPSYHQKRLVNYIFFL